MPGFCTKCGTALADGATFCTKCGAPVAGAVAAPATPAPSPTPSTPAPATGMSPAVKIVLGIIGAFVLLAVLFAVVVTVGVWKVAQNVSVDERAGKVTIKTDKGSLTMGQTPKVTEAQLGIPIYPGAEHEQGGFSLESEKGAVQTFVFKTSDSVAQVTEFYKSRLGEKAETSVASDDSAVFALNNHAGSDYLITVATEQDENKTVITVTRTRKGPGPGQ
jgi:hypothetical protein